MGKIPEAVDSEDEGSTDDEITSNDVTARIKKNSSIDDYKSNRGSKSNSKDINISDDLDDKDDEFGVKDKDPDFDPDIDVGDYDWTSYTAKKSTKLKTTHSDEDVVTDSASSLISPRSQGIRPQSARIESKKSNSSTYSPKPGFFASNLDSPTRKTT